MRERIVVDGEGHFRILRQRLQLPRLGWGGHHDVAPVPVKPDGDHARRAVSPDIGEACRDFDCNSSCAAGCCIGSLAPPVATETDRTRRNMACLPCGLKRIQPRVRQLCVPLVKFPVALKPPKRDKPLARRLRRKKPPRRSRLFFSILPVSSPRRPPRALVTGPTNHKRASLGI